MNKVNIEYRKLYNYEEYSIERHHSDERFIIGTLFKKHGCPYNHRALVPGWDLMPGFVYNHSIAKTTKNEKGITIVKYNIADLPRRYIYSNGN